MLDEEIYSVEFEIEFIKTIAQVINNT